MKWVMDQASSTLDYPTLGFVAEPGDILDASAAPDAQWSLNGDQGAAETVFRYALGSDPDYIEPTNGHVLTWDSVQNTYVPTAPELVNLPSVDAHVASKIDNPLSQTAVALSATIAAAPEVVERIKITEAPLSPYRYGFVGDGSADDTVALQATIDACPTGGTVRLPHSGNAKITAPLVIAAPITIQGTSRESQRILAVGCDGIHINAGVDAVRLRDFEIVQSVPHSTTPNTYYGVKVDSTSADYCTEHLYENLLVDGFGTAFLARYLWSSQWHGVRTYRGKVGISAVGKSVNNFVRGCRFTVQDEVGSRAIWLRARESESDATAVASEGWAISHLVTSGAEIAVDCTGYNHVVVGDSILDFCGLIGVRVQGYSTLFGNNVDVHDTYIGISGSAADAGIRLDNTVSNTQRRYARFHDNEMTVYSGGACNYGIYVPGVEGRATIHNNTMKGFTLNDIRSNAPNQSIAGNSCLSTAPTVNIHANTCLVGDNPAGTVNRTGVATTATYRRDSLGRRVVAATAAPDSGDWLLGERVIQDVPTVGQPKGWVCTVAGTPGTWVSEGNL